MNLTIYYSLILNEGEAKKNLLEKCFKNHQRFCPRCQQRKIYKLSQGRRRCSKCQYTFHEFFGRWINHGRLSYFQWLSIVKLFELEVSDRKMSEQMNLNYETVYKAVNIIRHSILAHTEDAQDLFKGEIEIDESYFDGR